MAGGPPWRSRAEPNARPGRNDPVGSPLRFSAAALLAIIVICHALVTEDYFESAGYLGLLYLLVEFFALGAAVGLCVRDTRQVWLTGALAAELGAVVYLLSRWLGVAMVSDDVGRWTQPMGALALAMEVLVLLLTGAALFRRTQAARWSASRLPLVGGLVVLQIGAAATFATASLQPGSRQAPVAGHTEANHADNGSAGYWAAVAGAPFQPTGVVRTYYVGADEVVWNYAPTGKNGITGGTFDEAADTFVKNGPGRIGSTYLKCLYRGYADATFATPLVRPASEAYLGIYGPVIRATVGDTIKVVFRNGCKIKTSVHPHGVFYQKSSEGAPYADNTSGADRLDDAVPENGQHTYTWLVPERAGPGPHDGSSVMWMYHSHTDEVADTYAGLIGPMVITAKGMARPDGSPKDVDREVFELFSVMDEGLSPYPRTNLERFAKRPFAAADDEGFGESNLMHSINGYVYGNQPMITLRKGQRVRWYVMGMGTEVDLHTPHWHGNDVVVGGMRMDVVNLLPASMVVADMVPDDVGVWLFHCHVNDHLTAGMIARYGVVP